MCRPNEMVGVRRNDRKVRRNRTLLYLFRKPRSLLSALAERACSSFSICNRSALTEGSDRRNRGHRSAGTPRSQRREDVPVRSPRSLRTRFALKGSPAKKYRAWSVAGARETASMENNEGDAPLEWRAVAFL